MRLLLGFLLLFRTLSGKVVAGFLMFRTQNGEIVAGFSIAISYTEW